MSKPRVTYHVKVNVTFEKQFFSNLNDNRDNILFNLRCPNETFFVLASSATGLLSFAQILV